MNERKLQIGVLFMALVIALAAIGVGYGLWSQILVLEGIVNTGEMDIAWSLKEVDQIQDFNDVCPNGGGYTIGQDCDGDGELNDDMEYEGKDVAECVAEILDPYTMEVTVSNAYPLFNCFVLYDVHNTGTIPVKIYRPDYFYEGEYMGGELFAIDTDALHVNGWPPLCYEDGTQLHPGEETVCALHISIYQGAEELTTYTFQVKIFGRQWNEEVGPPWRP
jgi:hypothetical protein